MELKLAQERETVVKFARTAMGKSFYFKVTKTIHYNGSLCVKKQHQNIKRPS